MTKGDFISVFMVIAFAVIAFVVGIYTGSKEQRYETEFWKAEWAKQMAIPGERRDEDLAGNRRLDFTNQLKGLL